ncbi:MULTISPECIES: pyridoxal phosphate-dependent aminotransferase [unclassified Streptomyces]|uniref:pyridoxal phosphate-dependent aminotransferase n=1 Tax=unclassified Streptomyces TaxID=2593676 RepID=UPI001F349D97|nr:MULTISPECIES: pyridoxal phosphate-dependent aminotransferase [unclassified Streptomyces]WKE71324.1 pyridoxal phosphate-dependent aminotransferase [Streptomyces sp. WP-1]
MSASVPVTMSATLAADEALARRRRAGEEVLSLAGGEIGLPVLTGLRERLGAAADRNAYGPVAGSAALRSAAAGYWGRRGLAADPALVVCGPGSKPLLFALLLAVGGDVVVPVPGWVSYAAQARLAGARPIPVATLPGEGGVPDPAALREAVVLARAAGRDPRCVVVTLPDNPTGTVATPGTVERLARAARELDLVVVSDEIYRDLVFDPARPAVSPAAFAPERTVVTTGLTKNLALGGWRLGVARLPEGPLGREVHTRLVGIASQIWSSTAAPVQAAAAWAFAEPPEVVAYMAAARRLHEKVVRAAAERFTAAGAALAPVRATCYLYPDFHPLRDRLAAVHDVRGGDALAALLADRYGVGLLPGTAFGESAHCLRLRVATSRLYGETDAERLAALDAPEPTRLPWIRAALDRVTDVLTDLTAPDRPTP